MAWTNPASFVANTMLTAEQLNTNVVNNLMALKNPPFVRQVGSGGGNVTTGLGTYADVLPALNITNFTTYGGSVMIGITGTVAVPAGGSVWFDIDVDGVRLGFNGTGQQGALTHIGNNTGVAIAFPLALTTLTVPLSASSPHTIKLVWRAANGVPTFYNNTTAAIPIFWAREV